MLRILAALPLASVAMVPLGAMAAFSDRPITLVVPFPAGGAADIMARTLALQLGAVLGQQVIVDNRGGGGGSLAAEFVARAKPDGLTLMLGTMGTHAINPALYPRLRYDPVADFTPISLTHITPRVLLVHADVPARSVAEFKALAQAQPGKLTYGSAGNGSSSHLSGALFESLANVDLTHVPYRGSAPLVTDLLAGRIDCTFDSYSVYEEHIRNGRVRALAVTSRTRMAALPQIPTLAESGLAGYEVSNWLGVFAPAGTPPALVRTLNEATRQAMRHEDTRRQLLALGIEPTTSTPEAFAALLRDDIPRWAQLVKTSGAQIE